ncbi:MAG TPA: RNA polymerase sigma factor [Rhizomicrobium sp.]|nr:RNA polymerase sigma factor [Rhizomicrobium sp.]
MSAPDLQAWFVREVLPLEAQLTQFLRHNWRNRSDIADLLQEIYLRVFDAAQRERPENTRAFVFATAQNLIIDRVRREKIVPIEAVAEMDQLLVPADDPSPDHAVIARDELRRLQDALDQLPPRCREAVILGRIEGLSGREIAVRMNVGTATVSEHLENGMRLLANLLYGEAPDSGKPK